MSLLDDFGRKCVLMEKTRTPDGAGAWETVWHDGAAFLNYQALDTSMEARKAEKDGVTSVYNVLVDKAVPIDYGDAFKDVESGEVYRVTSRPTEKQSPRSASFSLKFFTAERWNLPT